MVSTNENSERTAIDARNDIYEYINILKTIFIDAVFYSEDFDFENKNRVLFDKVVEFSEVTGYIKNKLHELINMAEDKDSKNSCWTLIRHELPEEGSPVILSLHKEGRFVEGVCSVTGYYIRDVVTNEITWWVFYPDDRIPNPENDKIPSDHVVAWQPYPEPLKIN